MYQGYKLKHMGYRYNNSVLFIMQILLLIELRPNFVEYLAPKIVIFFFVRNVTLTCYQQWKAQGFVNT